MSSRSMDIEMSRLIGMTLIVGAATLVGCGPSPEEQAATADAQTAIADAQTAAAATSTPTITPTATYTPTTAPTSTPTPIPYDLSALVTGEEGAPLVGATVALAEVGQEAVMRITDDDGQAFWNDLLGEPVNLSISEPGYFPLVISESIERGINEVTIALERDPHALLLSEACAPGEELLYIEDFQDGKAQGWGEIEFRAQGFDLLPHPDSPGDLVVVKPGGSFARAKLPRHIFENSVFRVRSMHHGNISLHFQWHLHEVPYLVDDQRADFSLYEFGYSASNVELIRNQAQLSYIDLYRSDFFSRSDVWHTIEISTYDGLLEVWFDGKRIVSYQDPRPMPGGGLGLTASKTDDANAVAYFDDISVCGLTQPFVPMPTPDP